MNNDCIPSEPKRPIVLIVDDTRIEIQIMATALSMKGYQTAVAMNGREALDNIEKISPDLILLDIMMPGMDGFEVCRTLKGSASTMDIPVIFLTVKDEIEDIVKGFDAGAVDYVTKPFNSSELLARVRTHVELKKKKDNEKYLISRLTATLAEQRQAEEALRQAHDNLELIVGERTAELLLKNRQLSEEIEERKRAEVNLELKSQKLEEFNTALKVLLSQRQADKKALEERVMANIKNLIMPHIKKLKKNIFKKTEAEVYVNIIESNLKNITSSFSQTLSSKYLNLTSKEIQVANLIKEGKISKNIAVLLNVSGRTVDFHRKNIRSKLGLQKKKGNLQSSLSTLS
jgi:DNA-binding response OmpR family regulator/DNA-binding CsgD family transcriptional regulator